MIINITSKNKTLRKASAEALVTVSHPETILKLKNKAIPKGNVLEFARTAALFAVKKTSDTIPCCHPVPVEYTVISYELGENSITIRSEVSGIYRTGYEVEAMHAVSIAALTIYDMLKPVDPDIQIGSIRILKKSGGKSDIKAVGDLEAAVIVCSDSISKGIKTDSAGKAIAEKLSGYGVRIVHYGIIPDEKEAIQAQAREFIDKQLDLVIFTGGTGLSARDVTPEALKPLIEREVPGIMEAARSYGQERAPYAMLSRGVAGFNQRTLLLAFPGSTRGAEESVDALFPHILHVFRVAGGARHDD